MKLESLLKTMPASFPLFGAKSTRARFARTLIVALLVIVCLTARPGASYARPEPPDEINSPARVEDDGGTAEMGVEWITDWPGTGDDRANWYYSANNLYNELINRGWIGRFNWGNTNAWEKDFKPPYGGSWSDGFGGPGHDRHPRHERLRFQVGQKPQRGLL